ncbi:DUF3034 family protein [Pseudoalteromonas peptidolytica]|uniref:DUF3034 family protein n=1 Tax=Pseudoalteromonas peptidolytica TaxID=61150 RepID=UPI00298DAC25|nr:DUF3034 family protein [Pseudoalteromonas peptidolytica]MDW7550372.1 DUF3034 family protein [Pseudoalteromonas peptidolytica]
MRWGELAIITLLFGTPAYGAVGKLLATPGVSQIEGSAGGGIVPWAQLAGYASQDEWSVSGFCSRASLKNYQLDVCGVQANLFNRVELSFARQNFDVDALNLDIEQDIVGAKVRLYGDIIYSKYPQLSIGAAHKSLDDALVADLLGAKDDVGTDYYIAASKLHLGAIAGYNWFWNVTLRHSRANQLGILGYGGVSNSSPWQLEASSAIFLSRQWAIGAEYRQKSNNLGLGESDWKDLFVAWFPNKSVNVTAAWLDLGMIAGQPAQTGWYLSFTGYF